MQQSFANDSALSTYIDEDNKEDFDFSLEIKSDQVEITWENFPKDIKGFVIQRSFDGKRYSNILQSNLTKQNFHQDDILGLPVEEMYYRFVFTLNDDETVTSASKIISLTNKDDLSARVYVSGGQVEFTFNSSVRGNTSVQIFNNVGNLITEDRINTAKGSNSHSITLYDLRNGMYFLRLEQNGKSTTTKFFVR